MTVHWRALGLADTPAWSALLAATATADDSGEFYSPEDLAEELEAPDLDADRGTLAGFADGRLVAFGSLSGRPVGEEVHRVWFDGSVHPDHRGRGLGGRLVAWAAERAPELHRERFPERLLEVHTQLAEDDAGGAELLEAHGYTPVRYFAELTMELADRPAPAPAPDGVRLVAYEDGYDEAARLVRNEAFRDHWGDAALSAELWRHHQTGTAVFRPELSWLALDAATGRAAGVVIIHHFGGGAVASGRRDAWISTVGTARALRGRGIASALVGRALEEAAAGGYDTASLQVDTASPTGADGLYRRLGFGLRRRSVRRVRVAA
jgi:mycothiol synthase